MDTLHELTRPWKPDWDIGISLIMAAVTCLTAPWSMRVMWSGNGGAGR